MYRKRQNTVRNDNQDSMFWLQDITNTEWQFPGTFPSNFPSTLSFVTVKRRTGEASPSEEATGTYYSFSNILPTRHDVSCTTARVSSGRQYARYGPKNRARRAYSAQRGFINRGREAASLSSLLMGGRLRHAHLSLRCRP